MPNIMKWIRQLHLRERFFLEISPEDKQAYQQMAAFENFNRMRILLLIMLVWFSIMLALDFQYFENWQTIQGYSLYMILDIVLLLIILSLFYFFQRRKVENAMALGPFEYSLIYSTAFILLNCIAIISSIEAGAIGSIPSFLIAAFVISTVFYFNGLFLALLFLFSFMALLLSIKLLHQDPMTFLLQHISVLGIVVFAWINSRFIHSGRLKRFMHEQALQRTNLRLNHEMQERIKTEKALQKAKTELENRVHMRTRDLSKAVRKLEKEVIVRKDAETQLRKSLDEKEVLIKEIYHRVKNNLQVIYSLLNIQARTAEDPVVKNVFDQNKERIHAMALVHELLYQSDDLSQIHIDQYIGRISRNLIRSHVVFGQQVKLNLDLESSMMPIAFAVPLGLILNELIINALKHAFPKEGKDSPTVTVSYYKKEDNSHVICVKDNGVGMPAAESTSKKHGQLGLQLVSMLGEDQLKGTIETRSDKGTAICVTIPLLTTNTSYL